MATIEDYRKQKILAEQLRKREAALGAAIQSGDPTLVTRGSRGATYDMPDIYQANIAGALAKAGGGYLAGRAGTQATGAETSAEEKRQAALEQVLGAAGVAGGTMTPQQAVQLQELGLDVDVGDFLPKPKTPAAPGAIIQGIQSGLPPDIVQKIARGEDLTPDEIIAVQKSQEEKYNRELQDKLRLKQTGGAGASAAAPKLPTDKQVRGQLLTKYLAAQTPEEKAAFKAQLDELDKLSGTGNMSPREENAALKLEELVRLSDSNLSTLEELNAMIQTPEGKEVFTWGQGLAKEAADSGIPGIELAGRRIQSPESRKLTAATLKAVLADMQALGGSDSNEELRTLRARQAQVGDDYASAKLLLEDALRWQKVDAEAARLIASARREGTYDPGYPYLAAARAKVAGGTDTYTANKKMAVPPPPPAGGTPPPPPPPAGQRPPLEAFATPGA